MRHATSSERSECVRLYSEGAMLKHLVERFNRPRPTINRWVRQADAKRGHKFRGHWIRLPAIPTAGPHQC
jgi:transposase-like protein